MDTFQLQSRWRGPRKPSLPIYIRPLIYSILIFRFSWRSCLVCLMARDPSWLDFDLTLRLHVRRQPPFGAQAMWDLKHQLLEQHFAKSFINCIQNAGSCARLSHWPNWWNRVCARSLLVQSCRGYPVFVHYSKATLDRPTGSKANSPHTSQISGDVWGIVQTKGSIHVVARVLLPCHSNDAESHAKVRSIPRNLAARRSCVTFCEKQRPVCGSHSSGLYAYWHVLNKLASNCRPGDAWNNIGQ